MIATLTLNPSLDYVMELSSIKAGEVNRSRAEALYPGGKGINVSLMLHRLGLESQCLGFSAGETGDLLCRLLQKEGVTPSFISVKHNSFTRINVKLRGETITELNGKGPTPGENEWKELFRQLDKLQQNDVLVVSGRFPTGNADGLMERVKTLCSRGVHLTADSSGEALRQLLAFSPLLAKPNLQELEELSGRRLSTLSERVTAAKRFWQKGNPKGFGAKHLLLSMGGEGAVLFWDDGANGAVLFLEPPEGKAVSAVGAGDCMLAGCLAGMERRLSPEEILRLAVGCGSATAFSPWLAREPAPVDKPVVRLQSGM